MPKKGAMASRVLPSSAQAQTLVPKKSIKSPSVWTNDKTPSPPQPRLPVSGGQAVAETQSDLAEKSLKSSLSDNSASLGTRLKEDLRIMADTSPSRLENARVEGTRLTGLHIEDTKVEDAKLAGLEFEGTKVQGSKLSSLKDSRQDETRLTGLGETSVEDTRLTGLEDTRVEDEGAVEVRNQEEAAIQQELLDISGITLCSKKF